MIAKEIICDRVMDDQKKILQNLKSGIVYIRLYFKNLTIMIDIISISGHVWIHWNFDSLSWKLKWAFLIARRPSVHLSVNISHFYLLSRTTWSISTKFGTKHYWVKGIQIWSKEGPHSFPREIITKNDNTLTDLKNLLQKQLTEGSHPFFQGEIITKKQNTLAKFQNLHWANFSQTWHKASLGKGDSSFNK